MMTVLNKCPCGEVPTDIHIRGQDAKWAFASGNCCNDWLIEFRTKYCSIDSNECKELAIVAWNKVPRG